MDEAITALADAVMHDNRLADLPGKLYIDGEWRQASAGRTMESFDPGTGQVHASFAAADATDVDAAVESSARAYAQTWRKALPAHRARILAQAARLVRENTAYLTVLESLDCGKPLAEALEDVQTVAALFDYYAGAADKLHGDTIPIGPDFLCCNVLEPVGVTAHIIPWNFPLFAMARGIAPALAAGCTVVVKPAETTPLSALVLAHLLGEAGLPPGVCNVVTGTGTDAGEPLCLHEKVNHITFTGSVPTGQRVMQNAARHIASVTLELGGKSPAIVLADCDVERAAEDMIEAIYLNAGQVCSAGSRLVVERKIHARFLECFTARARALTLGHGLKNRNLGAINSAQQLARISAAVDSARARQIEVALGGHATVDPESGKGWFFEATVLDDVPAHDPVIQQEIFGPVLAVQIAEDAEEALHLANGTAYGLVAGIYTRDISRALALARDLDVGQVTVNQYFAGGIYAPFGGNKASGIGREKGLEALRNYCRVKNITVRI